MYTRFNPVRWGQPNLDLAKLVRASIIRTCGKDPARHFRPHAAKIVIACGWIVVALLAIGTLMAAGRPG